MPTRDWYTVQRDYEDEVRHKPADDVKKRIVIPEPVPAGNRLAHFIRSVHWNSKGMLPSTAGSQRSYDKYNTVTKLSFQGPDGFHIAPGEAAGGFDRKRETVEDVMLTPRNQIFNRWKVPDRYVTESAPPTPAPMPATPSYKPDTPANLQPDVPNIKLKSQPTLARVESRNGLQPSLPNTPRSAASKPCSPPVFPVRRANTIIGDTRKKTPELNLNGMRYALKPEAVPQAEAWLSNASAADKQVIERVLKMAGKKQEVETSMRRTLLPDAKHSVEKWMKDANENGGFSDRERHVALDFFNSLAGSQLMGMTVDAQRKRLKDVINTLEEAKVDRMPYNGRVKQTNKRRKERISDGKLQYIRLLTPDTRKNQWMHTTWHHLPEYKDDDPVANLSSHYTRPHAHIPRHFVIHPDWG
ncbi:uncharacterized protein LOC128224867 isoform X3 [Mya arenaria]|uniref:uncharacterized protein LOC128224867 isoform X3 n=1 Tax=Mya arenaria TaxID=6604 RepID=UPI0022E28911|nr:uncharacterized protein LOC128224867 isoform X3 [Mya arenaria]